MQRSCDEKSPIIEKWKSSHPHPLPPPPLLPPSSSPVVMCAAEGAALSSGARERKQKKNPHSLRFQTDPVASLMQEGPDERY